jgi:hypothetical protein
MVAVFIQSKKSIGKVHNTVTQSQILFKDETQFKVNNVSFTDDFFRCMGNCTRK